MEKDTTGLLEYSYPDSSELGYHWVHLFSRAAVSGNNKLGGFNNRNLSQSSGSYKCKVKVLTGPCSL